MNTSMEAAKRMREKYPPGTQIRLNQMDDPYAPVLSGTVGKVDFVDDALQIHMIWEDGRTLALLPGVDDFTVIQPEPAPLKLYMPLTMDCYEQNKWGDYEEYPTEFSPEETVACHDNIFTALVKERMPEEAERGLMHWYGENDAVDRKVRSAFFSVEEQNGRLWGTAECQVAGTLSPDELDTLKAYLAGQASDGWGESFEQRPISTPDGEIYVHLWNSNDDWSMMTEDEFHAAQEQLIGGRTMGGIS
ncbi:MAG: DUF4314 domain-containing protein [Gracilibacteraceae bacterium]|jgi:hypothetical protein|nr:DUF4314 domain-containing protein [Gracilibacteraceae bacterium]